MFGGLYPPSSATDKGVADGGGLVRYLRACNFRFRRPIDMSPKTEVWNLFRRLYLPFSATNRTVSLACALPVRCADGNHGVYKRGWPREGTGPLSSLCSFGLPNCYRLRRITQSRNHSPTLLP